MKTWSPYDGERYLNWNEVESWCRQAADAHQKHCRIESVGMSRHGRPILLLTIGELDGREDQRPALWLDGGTHAAEWTGVMSTLYSVSRWLEGLSQGKGDICDWFLNHTIYVMPCISPDGFNALCEGAPFLRSSLRPPVEGAVHTGFEACDMDGDGVVRWMRWRHPAGSFVCDPDLPMFMRPRTLDDSPDEAYFFCGEGQFLNWDGHRWTAAPRRFGLDLNRNFPAHWAPFSMFGMDGGHFPASEPESRAVVEAFAGRPCISAGVTNHTYTGCILTQPYRKDTPLSDPDIYLMENLAKGITKETGYRVFRIEPDFTYDPKKAVVGVWSDSMCTTFGVPAYTLELWDPFGFCGVENKDPKDFFVQPDPEKIRGLVEHFSTIEDAVTPWRSFEHPQLGEVEIGGLDYMRTVRNPPVSVLAAECRRGHTVADRLRLALPRVKVHSEVIRQGDEHTLVQCVLENEGYLSTAGLRFAEGLSRTPQVSMKITCGDGVSLVNGQSAHGHEHIDGWACHQPSGVHSVYPNLPGRGHRALSQWWVRGRGTVKVTWYGGRGGQGELCLEI